ncbi:MAG: lysophospholipid acyltransferase family protein [Thermoguttaceae bacterium]|nr:lysophospholipid acyltransferase family protein [Thermoguttaceae bacterium]
MAKNDFPNPERPLSSRIWYESLRTLVQVTAVLGWKVRHFGRENIPPAGGVLVVSNHQSHFDPPLVGMACPRRMNYLARDTLFRFPPFRWLIRSLDAIPIDREGIGLSGIKESLRRLKRGEMVLVFPEGTRTEDGEIQPFRPGFTALAVRSRAAILPVAIEGAYQAWPRMQRLPHPGRIHVQYGQPILPDQIAAMSERALLAEVEDRVRACHALLRAQRNS